MSDLTQKISELTPPLSPYGDEVAKKAFEEGYALGKQDAAHLMDLEDAEENKEKYDEQAVSQTREQFEHPTFRNED